MVITDKNELLIRASGGADYIQYEITSLDGNSDLKTVAGFGIDGHDSDGNTTFFYEIKNGKNESVSQKRFDELQQQYPFTPSKEWLNTSISSIS